MKRELRRSSPEVSSLITTRATRNAFVPEVSDLLEVRACLVGLVSAVARAAANARVPHVPPQHRYRAVLEERGRHVWLQRHGPRAAYRLRANWENSI